MDATQIPRGVGGACTFRHPYHKGPFACLGGRPNRDNHASISSSPHGSVLEIDYYGTVVNIAARLEHRPGFPRLLATGNNASWLQDRTGGRKWLIPKPCPTQNVWLRPNNASECWPTSQVTKFRGGAIPPLTKLSHGPTSKAFCLLSHKGKGKSHPALAQSICHGGQTGVSQEVYAAVGDRLPDVVWTDLGPQPLRGLAQPVQLYQALPAQRCAAGFAAPLPGAA